jgi:hypothetical protein
VRGHKFSLVLAFMVLLSFGFAFEYLLDYLIVGKLHCFDKTETLTIGKPVMVNAKLLINFQSLLVGKGLILNIMSTFLS